MEKEENEVKNPEYVYVEEGKLDRSLECCVCLNPLLNPVIYHCGNMVCKLCSEGYDDCPSCGLEDCVVSVSVVPNFIKNQLNDLKVVCPSCDGHFKRIELENHRKICLVKCEHCNVQMEKGKMKQHLEECEHLVIECSENEEFCKWKGARKDHEEHTKECQYSQVKIPLAILNSKFVKLEQKMEESVSKLERKMNDSLFRIENKLDQLLVLMGEDGVYDDQGGDDIYDPNKPERVNAKQFKYVSDFDENGLLYWLGTNQGRKKWSNPMSNGSMLVKTSHGMHTGTIESVVGRVGDPTFWGGSTPQHFIIDLKEKRFKINHFTLRHGFNGSNSFIQDWELLASNDEYGNWTSLYRSKEIPFQYGYQTKTWPVEDGKDHFQFFKFVHFGNYSYGVGNPQHGLPYLCIAGFEMYGDLL